MPKSLFFCAAIVLLCLTLTARAGKIAVADSTAQINALIIKGMKFQDSTANSLPVLFKRLRQMSANTDNKRGLVYAQVMECHYYWTAANHTKAMQIGLQALADAEKLKFYDATAEIYGIMANLHKETGNFPMAFKDNENAIRAAKRTRDTLNIIGLLSQQAMFTHSFYLNKHKPEDDHRSLELEFEAARLAESKLEYERQLIALYDNISQNFKERKQYDKAIFYGNKGADLAKKYNRPRSLTYSYAWLGESYYYMGERERGVKYIKDAIAITQQLKQPFRQMELHETLYQCYESSGDYKEALASLKRSADMSDSLQVAKSAKQISELQGKFESDKKDKQIADLNELDRVKSRKLLWIMVGLVIFVMMIAIILYQNVIINANSRVIKQKNQMLHQALDKIAYVQSHQIRKPLASIMGLMNIIKGENYQADKEILHKMETAALDLDKNIREVISETEIRVLTQDEENALKW